MPLASRRHFMPAEIVGLSNASPFPADECFYRPRRLRDELMPAAAIFRPPSHLFRGALILYFIPRRGMAAIFSRRLACFGTTVYLYGHAPRILISAKYTRHYFSRTTRSCHATRAMVGAISGRCRPCFGSAACSALRPPSRRPHGYSHGSLFRRHD